MNEFELIELFISSFDCPRSPYGPGDDCAVLPPSPTAQCVTTDALVDGVHFSSASFRPEAIGHKALAVNLSDLAAMGARPRWALCALGLPVDYPRAALVRVARGMSALARTHGIRLIGGNVTRSPVLTLTLTVGGAMPPGRKPLLRSTARPGEAIVVSGPLGLAAAGLSLLSRPAARRRFPELVAAQQKPSPHVAWALTAAPWLSSAIDVSDGLLQDLEHVCQASDVGAELSTSLVPLSEALLSAVGPDAALENALRGGEDYVILGTVKTTRLEAMYRALAKMGFWVGQVGVTTRERGLRLDGSPVDPNAAFQHFADA
jgi:thiamine-monophosphate kinase